MVERDKQRFQQAMAVLAETHQKSFSSDMLLAYFMALSDLTIEQVERGIGLCMRECQFFPKPVEIRQRAGAVKSVRLEAIEAWNLVMENTYERHVRIGPLDFGEVINATVRAIGGVDRLSRGTVSELESFTRPRFIEAYELIAQSNDKTLSGQPLVGEGAEGKPVQRIGQAAIDRPGVEHKPMKAVVDLAGQLMVSKTSSGRV